MKKILSVVVSLFLILSIIPVYADNSTETNIANSPDVAFATSLGILEKGSDPLSSITRIELAKVFYNIILSQTEGEVGQSKYFTDVDLEESVYADFAYECSVMNGTGNGLFAPDATVTYAQFIKTVVSFLGYTAVAESKGGYPAGYISVASQLDITSQIPPSYDSVINKNMVASVFKLAGSVPLMNPVTYGDDSGRYEIDNTSNYLNTYMHISRFRGIVTGNYLTDFNFGSCEHNQVAVNGEVFYVTTESIGLINELGCEVDVYSRDYGSVSVASVIYYELTDVNNKAEISYEAINDFENMALYYGENNKKYVISPTAKVIYNGTLAASYDKDTINPFAKDTSLEGGIRLVDNNYDNRYDVVMVDAYTSFVVSKVVGNRIFSEFSPYSPIDLGAKFNDGDIEITNVIGQPMKVESIEEGNILSVYRDKNNNVKRMVVTIDTYMGILEEINYSSGIMTVNGFDFTMSAGFLSGNNSTYEDLELGKKFTLYFDKEGKVSYVKAAKAKYEIGYLAAYKKSTSLDAVYTLKIFTYSGDFEELQLGKKVKLSDTERTVSAKEAVEALPLNADGNIRQPILYTVNDDGKINWIDWPQGTTPRNGLYTIEGFDGSAQELYYRSSQMSFQGKLLLGTGTVIFNIPPAGNETNYDNYYIESTKYYQDGKQECSFEAYGLSETGSPCASIIVEKNAMTKLGMPDLTDVFVVDSVTKAMNEEGVEAYKFTGCITTSATSYFIDEYLVDTVFADGLPERGDIVRLNVVNGKVNNVEKVFDFSSKDSVPFAKPANPTSSNYTSSVRYMWGDIIYNDKTYIKIKAVYNGKVTEESYPVNNFSIIEVDFSEDKKGVVRNSTSSCVYDTVKYPGFSSKVVIHTYKGNARTMVVYNGLGGTK
ncbi:MAG: S-layer homology domain-containing protein [Clostridia bacterium]|nr:S-layer homology domain-containing protein [Clostridia bacterium]